MQAQFNVSKPKKVELKQKRSKIPYYQKKKVIEVRKPWSKPMAAQHLAAIKIQRLVKKFVYKLRKSQKQPKKKIQSQNSKSNSRLGQGHSLSEMQHFTAMQRLRSKFLTSPYNIVHLNEEDCWRNYCAAIIQAMYKMALTRRLFKYHRFAMYHIAAIQIQWAWRGCLERQKKVPKKSRDQEAVERIQKAWRSFTNVKIFKYYKDLINFKQKGDPNQLLKSVNPHEASLLDGASRCHIRFRLGGDKFPPLIYYKIFTHGSIVDINAFAPRDYEKMRKEKKKTSINVKIDKGLDDKHDGWYNRAENNGWRPISDKILTPFDAVEIRTNQQTKKYHYNKLKRKELTAQEKRNKKLKWLRKLYRDAKNAELNQEEPLKESEQPAQYDNPFDDNRFQELEDPDFDEEVNNLIEWCEDLDYDKYMNNWNVLATSAYAGTENFQEYMNHDRPLEGFGLPMEGVERIQEEDGHQQTSMMAGMTGEDQFMQRNLEYEQRLKQHLYQFEDSSAPPSIMK